MRRLHRRLPWSQRRIGVGRQRQTDALVRLVERRPQLAEVGRLHRDAPCAERRRSEEHTSELQSPCNLVCRLLLEKKKNKNPWGLYARQHSSWSHRLTRAARLHATIS